jgi:endo-1,4-beta-xylanase
MRPDDSLTRRSVLLGAGVAAAGLMGQAAPARGASALAAGRRVPLWRRGVRRGIAYGSSAATWQLSDPEYRRLFAREAGILFTEDDLLWYRLKPTPDSPLDFSFGDQIIEFAERRGMLVLGAHLVWDEGFGEGWTPDDLFGMDEQTARRVLFGTLRRTVARYRGRVDAWIVVNEAIGTEGVRGLRTDVPWYQTIGRSYVAEAFRLAHANDPDAVLVLNEFGFETVNEFGDRPEDKRRAALQVIDELLADDVPVHAFGVQAHLLADRFAQRFDPRGYRRFLSEVADRGLEILITELDVLDDGLPADRRIRDRGVADIYRRYLDAALAEPAVKCLITFGLSDRYTWLQEDMPREDGAPRRPLPFDQQMRAKRAFFALRDSLVDARWRRPLFVPPRARKRG